MSIITVDATHPQNFRQRQGAWPSHVQGVFWYGWPGHVICSCPSERTSSVMEQLTKMNVRSTQIKRDYLCFKSLQRVSFEEVLFFLHYHVSSKLTSYQLFSFSFPFSSVSLGPLLSRQVVRRSTGLEDTPITGTKLYRAPET